MKVFFLVSQIMVRYFTTFEPLKPPKRQADRRFHPPLFFLHIVIGNVYLSSKKGILNPAKHHIINVVRTCSVKAPP